MPKYRQSRNIEASLIDYIKTKLDEDGWQDINVTLSFSKVYDLKLPVICVKVSTTTYSSIELGSNSLLRKPLILINIFGSSESNKLDLKDWLISILKNGFDYYEYTIEKDQDGARVISKIKSGYLSVNSILETDINLGEDKTNLDEHDRYRMQLSLRTTLNVLE